MANSNTQKPVVLVLAGHDPSGGAGIQADIESISNAGCHAVTIVTALTTQNTCRVDDIIPQNPDLFKKQIQLLLQDIEINACKIGVFGSIDLINVARDELSKKEIPIVLDPVIKSGSGTVFSNKGICQKIISDLFPVSEIITPNSEEAKTLSGTQDLNDAAEILFGFKAKNILITGTHENTEDVINTLFLEDRSCLEYKWPRLKDEFHGSGCTLSSHIAAQLARGEDIVRATEKAQDYTWNSLKHGIKIGKGQTHPNRFFRNEQAG